MGSKYEALRDALLACEVEAEVRNYSTSDGDRSDVAGTIPTNIHAGAGNSHHFEYSSWFLGRGRWLCLESEVLYQVSPDKTHSHLPAVRQAIEHANSTGYWVTQFVQGENGVVARMATMLPTDRSLEEIVRTLIEDFVQAIDACHYLFAVAAVDGVFLPKLLDDPSYVLQMIRVGLLWEQYSATTPVPGAPPVPGGESEDDGDEDREDEDEEEDEEEEEEIEIDGEDEDDGDDP